MFLKMEHSLLCDASCAWDCFWLVHSSSVQILVPVMGVKACVTSSLQHSVFEVMWRCCHVSLGSPSKKLRFAMVLAGTNEREKTLHRKDWLRGGRVYANS